MPFLGKADFVELRGYNNLEWVGKSVEGEEVWL